MYLKRCNIVHCLQLISTFSIDLVVNIKHINFNAAQSGREGDMNPVP